MDLRKFPRPITKDTLMDFKQSTLPKIRGTFLRMGHNLSCGANRGANEEPLPLD